MTKRRITAITGTRAEFGLLRWLLQDLADNEDIDLRIIATGSHLSPEFGMTVSEITAQGFQVDHEVEILLSSDSRTGVIKSMGLALIGLADALQNLKPDLVIILGDRFEIFAAASAALVAGIPIAHIHGGEVTEGAIDDSFRHAISKMSHLHFVAAEPYRQRLIQLGEQPDSIHAVGGLGVDGVVRCPLLTGEELHNSLGFALPDQFALVTYHPETINDDTDLSGCRAMLAALDHQPDCFALITKANADHHGRAINAFLEAWVADRPGRAQLVSSLGQQRFFSCMAAAQVVIGNSSSGLLEAPTFKVPTINIGDRQKSRLAAASVIHAQPNEAAISSALNQALSAEWQQAMTDITNPYGDGGASRRIHDIVTDIDLTGLTQKAFYDLPQ